MKNQKGLTLTSLIVTVIVMVMIVGIVLLVSVGEEGIIERANEAKRQAELSELKEKIGLEYMGLKNNEANKDKTTSELFIMLDQKMNLDEEHIGDECMIIKLDQDRVITLLEDGTIIEGRIAILNIANGNIDIKSKGFIQNNGELVEYTGDYIITGTTTEYCVRIMEEGTYNVTIKNLNIDMTGKGKCAFNANRGLKPTGCFVTLKIEGENKLIGGPALGFAKATPNLNGVTNGSTLTIEGNGKLEAIGEAWTAGIGTGYTGWDSAAGDAVNIIINSGNIIAKTETNGCAIGGGLHKGANNIIINGGNITAKSQNRSAIGASGDGVMGKIIINGGNITADGGEYGGAIGGNTGSGEVIINGGNLNLEHTNVHSGDDAVIGNGTKIVKITGGNIRVYSKNGMGIGNYRTLPFELIKEGGSIIFEDKICSTPVNMSNETYYLTKIKVGDLGQNILITKLETDNDIEYDINNLYTSREGHIFMLLPKGEVKVTVIAKNKTYTGTVYVTPENTEIFTLN